jgi:hypothetical protein
MLALESVKIELEPRLDRLVEHLTAIEEVRGAAFFAAIRDTVSAVEEEADLLEAFFALSTVAFQGFDFDGLAASLADEVLAYAEQVSHAFMASENTCH